MIGHGGLYTGHTAGLWSVPECSASIAFYVNPRVRRRARDHGPAGRGPGLLVARVATLLMRLLEVLAGGERGAVHDEDALHLQPGGGEPAEEEAVEGGWAAALE